MQYSFSDEQEQFRDIVGRFMREKSPTSEVRRLMETSSGYDTELWGQMNKELGLSALAIPEEYGGQGFGFVELAIVLEEMGRNLLCAPFFSSAVLATQAILNTATEQQKLSLLPDIASGRIIATLAMCEASGSWRAEDVGMLAVEEHGEFRLSGQKHLVTDGMCADVFVVAACLADASGKIEPAFFLVKSDASGLTRSVLDGLDSTRKLAHLNLEGVSAELLGVASVDKINRTIALASIALANEMVGGCQFLLDSAIEYAKMRMQFGRPIASFQAIKHMCADMLLEVELARSAAYQAAQAAADDDSETLAMASLAKACVSDTYLRTAATCIQIHGGIGFTWDNDTHLWFKRAKSSEEFLGGPMLHRELLMQAWAVQ